MSEKTKRDAAYYERLAEVIVREIKRNSVRRYPQYTRAAVLDYLKDPARYFSQIVEISRFLERNSMLYKKILMYIASLPLYYYDLSPDVSWDSDVVSSNTIGSFKKVAKYMNNFDLKKEFTQVVYSTIRDGMYVGYTYTSDESSFFMPLDINYCRVYGKNSDGQIISYFDATFFDIRENNIFVKGDSGVWDDVFVEGYNLYKEKGSDYRWFRLPPEKTLTLINNVDDDPFAPLPLFAPLFVSIMDLIDQELIIASRTELNNYKLLINKIPLINNTEEPDDFAISDDFFKAFNEQISEILPELVASVCSPMDVEVVDFTKQNTAKDIDDLSSSVNNFFNNAGVSQIVVAGGESTNSVGLKHAIQNDIANAWILMNKTESWINFFIKSNISDGYVFEWHRITWYNEDEYINRQRDIACVGGSAMRLLTATGLTPFNAYNKIVFEDAINLKNRLQPLNTSYTISGSNVSGDEDETKE